MFAYGIRRLFSAKSIDAISGFRASGKDRCNGTTAEGSNKDQPVVVDPRKRHFRFGRWEEQPHSLQELKAHSASAGFARRQFENRDGEFQNCS